MGEKWTALQVRLGATLAQATVQFMAREGSVEGLRVLDIGCGAGRLASSGAEGGVQVTGLDVSTPMLAVAARRTQGKVALAEAEAVTLGRAIWLVDAVRSI